jgi:hypothetical protein
MIGFRCAMTRMGSSAGNDSDGGNYFGKQKKAKENINYNISKYKILTINFVGIFFNMTSR